MDTPDAWRDWLARFPKEPPERMSVALAAVDAFGRCLANGRAAAADLDPILLAASSRFKLVFETGCRLLMNLTPRLEQAREALLRMSSSGDAATRFHAVAFLDWKVPETVRRQVILAGLRDKSPKVRAFAVMMAERFVLKALLPALEELRRVETHDVVLKNLDLHLPLLRDGYRLQPTADGKGFDLSVSIRGGLTSVLVPSRDAAPDRIRQAVDRILKERGAPGPA